MSIKMSVNGKALEYFTIKVNNGFSVEDLAYLILGWENDYKKIKKIKSYSKLMNIAKKQLMDKGLIWLECPTENLEYDIDGVWIGEGDFTISYSIGLPSSSNTSIT